MPSIAFYYCFVKDADFMYWLTYWSVTISRFLNCLHLPEAGLFNMQVGLGQHNKV